MFRDIGTYLSFQNQNQKKCFNSFLYKYNDTFQTNVPQIKNVWLHLVAWYVPEKSIGNRNLGELSLPCSMKENSSTVTHKINFIFKKTS